MIRLETSEDNKVVVVDGSKSDVMLFYCFWQTHVWPDWMNYGKLGEENETSSNQHKQVIKSLNEGRGLSLYNVGEQFTQAIQFATNKCKLLDIETITVA